MSQQELLNYVASILECEAIPFMLTGSFVSSLQGEPRSTHDIDFVVELSGAQASQLVSALNDPALYLSAEAVREALARTDQDAMFNVLDSRTGTKVDFWILSDDPFDQSRFARRQEIAFEGTRLFVSTPEDTILMKLRWARRSGGSEKQTGDAIGVYGVQRGVLDETYLDHWAQRLGVADLLARVRSERM